MPPAIQVVFVDRRSSWSSSSPSALFTMRNFGRRILDRAAVPAARILELYDRFEEGVFGAVGLRQLPDPRRPDRSRSG